MCQVVSIFNAAGEVIGAAWRCGCYRLPNGELESMEDRWVRQSCEAQMALYEADRFREATALHDPNRCDTRRVRRELHEPNIINLGLKVNRLSSKARLRNR